ncbi:MarR family winged helix-turn-helix transcriptional regulator [Marinobacterium mangrovicola]|uniref:MarR family transcriptional regulator for hemolysin n=1 Tax=Marinobacterium mangrovicola TaxID=1476959 RepID=A0A4R1GR90_9GAMM|nr:MarR family transcriptional regulator [Marinobacterium mangrovicola]TCK08699.1 MarR family transcriptional regulator for hemolysin [Marinobacterium mangrovicola]
MQDKHAGLASMEEATHIFGYRLVSLARRWRRFVDMRLAEAGLTDATWVPLMHLYRNGDGISQKELASRAGLDKSTLVRLLDLLVEKSLLERRVDTEDRRARLIYLTDAGRRQVDEINTLVVATECEALGGLDESTVLQMLNYFESIETRLDLALENPQQ